MKSSHTTNYCDTFIEVADDCPVSKSEVPMDKNGNKTIASAQYEMISKSPYTFTSDDVIFAVFAQRNNIAKKDQKMAREEFFSKGQACLRSSPLTKRYGFGIHSKADGKVALYAMESARYKKFMLDKDIKHLKAMRSERVK
ncbi:MAG: hypothetical protein HY036_09315 [Nitrospirae bacterium]|nr:hypothetical protein [Nitrospirota bacterium]